MGALALARKARQESVQALLTTMEEQAAAAWVRSTNEE